MIQRILDNALDWETLSEQVRGEQRNRERYYPSISVYRWWARRSHALIGTLIDQGRKVLGDDIMISDPMAGGGTVAIEAARRGLKVHAQDINPWAAFGLETALKSVEPDVLEEAANRLMTGLEGTRRQLYGIPGRDGAEVVTQLHVRRYLCSHCDKENYLFPTPLVALDKRITSNPESGWFGCPACGKVHQSNWPEGPSSCPYCGFAFEDIAPDTKRIVQCKTVCAHCKNTFILDSDLLYLAVWHPVLSLVAERGSVRLETAPGLREAEIETRLDATLTTPIQDGRETSALLRWGYRNWLNLYTSRQLAAIDATLSQLDSLTVDHGTKQRLLLAIIGFAEMGGYAARWDPKYRKVYEIGANHHYSRVVLAAEINPLANIGRGTLQKRLDSSLRAARWFAGSNIAQISCGSSEHQSLPDASVDLVITDPPYYDCVQYGELSGLFRIFGMACGMSWLKDEVNTREAVPNRYVGCSHEDYIQRLDGIFSETARTIKPNGRMLLTFHHPRIKAWEAVARALRLSGWQIISVAVAHSENEKDFAKNNKNSITSDAIIECIQKKDGQVVTPRGFLGTSDNLSKNILAISLAIAVFLNESSQNFSEIYLNEVEKLQAIPIMRP